MNKKTKIIASTLAITVLATSIFTFASLSGKNFFARSSASTVNGTITMTKAGAQNYTYDSTNNVITATFATSNGKAVYYKATGGKVSSSSQLGTIPSKYEGSSYADPVIAFYEDSNYTIPFKFQNVSSLSIVTSGSVTVLLQTSSTSKYYSQKSTLSCGTTSTSFDSFDNYDRYIQITSNSDSRAASNRNITSITISYACQNSPLDTFTSGEYTATITNSSSVSVNVSLSFIEGATSYYYYTNSSDSTTYQTAFTWVYDSYTENIVITYASGGTGKSTAYQGCKILYSFSSGKQNTLGCVGNTISLFLFTGTTESTIWDSPVIFTKTA